MKKSGVIIDKKGDAWIPKSLLLAGPRKVNLSCAEFLVWIFMAADGPEEIKKEYAQQGMSRTTFWRARKKLKVKGLL